MCQIWHEKFSEILYNDLINRMSVCEQNNKGTEKRNGNEKQIS